MAVFLRFRSITVIVCISKRITETYGESTRTHSAHIFQFFLFCFVPLVSYTFTSLRHILLRQNFSRNYTKVKQHMKTKKERCASYASAYIRDEMGTSAQQQNSDAFLIPTRTLATVDRHLRPATPHTDIHE